MGYYYCGKWLSLILSMWVIIISCSEANEYLVGDGKSWSWKVPLPSRDILSRWASSHNFLIGDTIVFTYKSRRESVRQVNEEDYASCKARGNHVVHNMDRNRNTNRNTMYMKVVVLNKIGMYYFISGNKRHCKGGLRLALLVTQPPIPPPPPVFPPPPSLSFPPPTPPSAVALPPPPPPPASDAFPPPPPPASDAFPPLPPSPLAPAPAPLAPAPSPSPSLSPSPSQSPSASPSESPSWAPSPSPNTSGSGGGGELMIWLGVSMAMMMMMFTI